MRDKLINLIILIVGVLLIVNLTRTIFDLLKTGDQVKEAEIQLKQEQAKNNELKKKLTQVSTPEFLEEMARDKLGLSRPGERVVILPSSQPAINLLVGERKLSNFEKWWNLLFN